MNKEEKQVQQAFLDSEKETIKELKQVYNDALKDCQIKIMQLSARADMNPENLQSIIYQKNYQEIIKAQLEGVLANMQSDSYATVSEYLTACYQNGFIGTMYDIAGQGIPLVIPIDQNAVVKAIYTDSKLSTNLYSKMGEDINALKKSIRSELSRGIANGSTWNDIALRISSHDMDSTIDLFGFKRAYNNSLRIARTEGHRVQIQSAMDAQEKAKKAGADVVKQWDATLDGNTRDSHRMLDGQIREVGEPFEIGNTKVDAPGMFGDPAEDCNCRCALLQRARWALDEDELATLRERASYHGLMVDDSKEFGHEKAKDFSDFKEKYLNATKEDVDKMGKNGTIEIQKPNNSIENAIGIKLGSPLSANDAAVGANPNYNQGREYKVNCQRCVQAYEFRRRGYEVTAMPKPSSGNTVSWGSECFIKQGESAVSAYTLNQTESAIKKIIDGSPDGSRFSVYVQWKGRNSGAHVFVAEKENGNVRYLDPQTGNTNVESYFMKGKKGKFGIFRMDDKQITSDESIIKETVKGVIK